MEKPNDKPESGSGTSEEGRKAIGQAIIDGLVNAGRAGFLLMANYAQGDGGYWQSDGGTHRQNSGDYHQGG